MGGRNAMARFKDFVPHGVIPAVLLPFHDELSLIVFQYPLATGQGYPAETLSRLLDEIPTIRAVKDWTTSVPQHEAQIRALQSRKQPVNVLSTNSAWLLSSLVLGCKGLLSGSGSVIPDLQAQLFRAVTENNLAEARRVNDRIYPLARVFYADPWADMHNRMKEALVLLGRLPRAVVRPPLVKLSRAEIELIQGALEQAGLLETKSGRDAALPNVWSTPVPPHADVSPS